MVVEGSENMVDAIADKVIAKLRNISFEVQGGKDRGTASANFVGYQMQGNRSGGKERNRGNFQNRFRQQRGEIQEISGAFCGV